MCEAISKEQAKIARKAQEWGSLDKSRELTEMLRAHRVRGLMKQHHAMMRVSAEHRDPKAPSFHSAPGRQQRGSHTTHSAALPAEDSRYSLWKKINYSREQFSHINLGKFPVKKLESRMII